MEFNAILPQIIMANQMDGEMETGFVQRSVTKSYGESNEKFRARCGLAQGGLIYVILYRMQPLHAPQAIETHFLPTGTLHLTPEQFLLHVCV